ncbi:glycosyltransferase involved in cell wall biosynthesis [Leeuwenhoekiella aestuarii]|uniref:Glycosyltransferase involved in cell wall biosynthesis n=1 Tax=Leeuwenhoekiella aestuarii TaxID=2249426 RepID=A0A4Q0NSU9_9FLAO|nr:glycosyltransferase family 4 protein [Leeuwenhoekiella aestuarii]RXG12644.1 glycosyltransferase involved in cell wall biosynthesis [Leeuwenhoekiella aestuarii]RXG14591.1 glycosyltransferase involved in cell wall biosynthesis [Leeuwenhoekiella aestuarii]
MKVLFIGNVWPEPVSSAAGTRIMQLIQAFHDMNAEVHFACAAGKTPLSEDLSKIKVAAQTIKLNNESFDEYISDLNPDIVVFDKFVIEEQFGWRVKEQCPDTVRILETIDLHGLRKGREASLKVGESFSERHLHNDFAKRELASIYRCDLTLVISEFERNLLKDFLKVPDQQLCYLPFLVAPISDEVISNWKPFEERKHFVTIGNFRHEPNWVSVRYLKTEIWPLIRKQLPDAAMRVYGSYPAEKHAQLHNPKENFYVLGRAESAHEVIEDARVLLAPLVTGAGLKGKLLDAMQCGTPAVTTSVGAEGMHGKLDFNGSVTDDFKDFANGAVSLYQDVEKWSKAQCNGVRIINKRFQKTYWQPVFHSRIKGLLDHLDQHRQANFTGAMLWHQSLQASKFMSKWIEEKNKKTS